MLKKTNQPGVFKDTQSGTLINKNKDKMSAYKAQKRLLQQAKETTDTTKHLEELVRMQGERISKLEAEIESLKKTKSTRKKKAE